MNKKELIKLLDKYEIEYEITDNKKEVEEGLRLFDEALEKIGIIIPKETQVDTITTENDAEVPKYTTKWASSDDCISRQAVLDFPIRLDHYDRENGNRHFVLGIESVMEYVESLPPVEPPKKAIAQIKVDTDEIVERIKEEYEITDRPVCEDAISRADTLKALCAECDVKCEDGIDKESYCTEYAVVKGMPPVEPKVSEDCISKEAVMDIVCLDPGITSWQYKMLKELPSVIPKRPKGEWVDTSEGTFCSECDFKTNEYYNYCPNCGADMRGKEE